MKIALAMLLLAPVPVVTGGGQDQLATARAEAAAGAGSPEGKAFDETVAQAFGRDHAKSIQQCAKETKGRDLSNFDVFLRFDAQGVVESALVDPSTSLSTCVHGKMTGWTVSVPPAAGFWVKVDVKLKGK